MSQRFLALVKANIRERIDINDELITAYSDIVLEKGDKFSGEIVVSGVVHTETDEATLGALLVDYLKTHTDVVRMIKVEFRGEVLPKARNTYRRAG